MCGFAGFIAKQSIGHEVRYKMAETMANTLVHRGPDDTGVWADTNANYAVGFRRLSILDLTKTGHQPMLSACGRWVLAFNGEVYNFKELRQSLLSKGIKVVGQSDSEVVLYACATWGVKQAVEKFVGMFAFSLWDCHEQSLYLVRDRIGIKPLYWGEIDGAILFGSELRALRAYSDWNAEIDWSSVSGFLRHTYCPTPGSIYKNIQKLSPGSILKIGSDGQQFEERYWNLSDCAAQVGSNRSISLHDAMDQFHELFKEAVKLRMLADVPVGALLSGGVDSASVVAMMSEIGGPVPKTFSIGFREDEFDEAPRAHSIAKHLGTDHTELYLTADDAMATVTSLADHYDEPFADSSQIPTLLVSKLARENVTVALTGDGGDELFGGYGRYFAGMELTQQYGAIPILLRKLTGRGIEAISPDAWSLILSILPKSKRPKSGGRAMHWLAEVLKSDPKDSYRHQVSIWTDPTIVLPEIVEQESQHWAKRRSGVLNNDFFRYMQYMDTLTYLPDDILTKVDRASMAHSLEARVPLLDHRIVEFAWTLPTCLLQNGSTGKLLLRSFLKRYLPDHLVDGPKRGFGVPIGVWMRGPLRGWTEDHLADARQSEMFDAKVINNVWQSHLNGEPGQDAKIWAIIMFQAWKQRWL